MKYLIIGNGVAGTTAADVIRKNDPVGTVTIISDEEHPFYSRIKLIEFLAGEIGIEELVIKKPDWYKNNNIDLVLNDPVVKIDKDNRTVITRSGRIFSYAKLLIATGSNSFIPPIPGAEKKGVFTLRRINDASAILEYLSGGPKNITIIGGGVLGLEVGNALRRSGHKITVIEAFQRLLPKQMDPEGSKILKKQLEGFGLTIYTGLMTEKIMGDDFATGLKLNDGTEILSDIIIISAGVRPELTLARELGLSIGKGIIVNKDLTTSEQDIYAAGDGIQHEGNMYGIWSASEAQGRVAGINMAGGEEKYFGTTMSNVLKVIGIDLISIGNIDAEDNYEQLVFKDPEKFTYKKLVLDQGKIIGAIFYGDKSNWHKVKKYIETGKDISNIKSHLELWDLSIL